MIVGIQDELLKIHSLGLLDRLLMDKTTQSNIIWGTDAYDELGKQYGRNKEITPELITGEYSWVIKNRARKALEQQNERTRKHAEVFTPLWVCEKMNDYIDEAWFGRKQGIHKTDKATGHIVFTQKKKWNQYVDSRRLEITCGEAPYLVSRYDVSTGEIIPLEKRIGILDRKLRAVTENTETEEEWVKWAIRAFQATYGYEFQGDNLLIARLNLLLTFEESLFARWMRKPSHKEYLTITNIICWNVWQMDGLAGTIPYRKAEGDYQQIDFSMLLGLPALSDGKNKQPECRINNWRRGSSLAFLDVNKGERKMKFDFIIGNPPYQDETTGDNKGFAPPIYHKFLENAYRISDRVEMIHPARFLFNAGSTPKAWNRAMLNDSHLKVLLFESNSSKIFQNTDIKGGIAITYHDNQKDFGKIGTFTTCLELNSILKKIKFHDTFSSFSDIVVTRTAYRLTDTMHTNHPEAMSQLSDGHAYDMSTNIFERLPQIFSSEKPEDDFDYIQIIGREKNSRVYKYVRRDFVNDVKNLDKFKIFLPKANGIGTFGEILSSPILSSPGIGSTETFLSIGFFDTEEECSSLLKYIKSKFSRSLLGILKTTQDLTPEKWKYVPLQDFTDSSDIDWSKSIPEIDQQLYAKYGLDENEIAFIESHVKEMA